MMRLNISLLALVSALVIIIGSGFGFLHYALDLHQKAMMEREECSQALEAFELNLQEFRDSHQWARYAKSKLQQFNLQWLINYSEPVFEHTCSYNYISMISNNIILQKISDNSLGIEGLEVVTFLQKMAGSVGSAALETAAATSAPALATFGRISAFDFLCSIIAATIISSSIGVIVYGKDKLPKEDQPNNEILEKKLREPFNQKKNNDQQISITKRLALGAITGSISNFITRIIGGFQSQIGITMLSKNIMCSSSTVLLQHIMSLYTDMPTSKNTDVAKNIIISSSSAVAATLLSWIIGFPVDDGLLSWIKSIVFLLCNITISYSLSRVLQLQSIPTIWAMASRLAHAAFTGSLLWGLKWLLTPGSLGAKIASYTVENPFFVILVPVLLYYFYDEEEEDKLVIIPQTKSNRKRRRGENKSGPEKKEDIVGTNDSKSFFKVYSEKIISTLLFLWRRGRA